MGPQILTKEQTLTILFHARMISFGIRKFRFCTKTQEKCMNCFSPIYISHKQFDTAAIHCDACKHKTNPTSVVQLNYVRVIKERQLQLLDKTTRRIIEEIQ